MQNAHIRFPRIAAAIPILLGALCALPSPAANADPGPATAHVQRVLSEGEHVATEPDREAELGRLLDRDFDLALIARAALGQVQARMSEAERIEYVALLREQVVLAMLREVVLTRVQDIAIIEARDLLPPESMIVTRMVDAHGNVRLASWRVRAEGGQQKVVDVVVDGVGLAGGQAPRAALPDNGGPVSDLLAALRAQNARLRAALR
jgi:ABC-type transporter MlaC component